VLGPAAARRGGAAAFQHSVRRIFGDTTAAEETAKVASNWSKAAAAYPAKPYVAPAPRPVEVPIEEEFERPLGHIFRTVFPKLGTN